KARLLARFDRAGKPLCAALSADGTLAATGDFDGVVRLWRSRTGTLVRSLIPAGPRTPITAVALSADASQLAAATGSRALVWRLQTRAPPLVYREAHEV